MNSRTRIFGIVGALILSGALVGGAYIFSGPNPFTTANAASTDELLKSYTAKDTDNDGLPDWKEALYGTDPKNPMSFKAGVKDGDAVAQGLIKPRFSSAVASSTPLDASNIPGPTAAPGSFTDQFSQQFFTEYMQVGGGQPLTADQTNAIVADLIRQFTEKTGSLYASSYTASDVHVSADATISSYAGAVEQATIANDVPREQSDPVNLMQAYLGSSDQSAKKKLLGLSDSYAKIARDLAVINVPPQLAEQHLGLMRSFDGLAKATKGVTNYENDPLSVLGAIGIYQPAAGQVIQSLKDISVTILAQGTPVQGEPGFIIVHFVETASQQQKP